MDKGQKRQAIDRIMSLEYGYDEPWCKVLQFQDFNETNTKGILVDETWRKHFQEEIDYMQPENTAFRDAFLRCFLYRLFVDYTPESMDTEPLIEQEWLVSRRPEARFAHIIARSLEELKDFSGLMGEEYPEQENYEKFVRLKNSFLEVFTSDVIFLENADPDDEMPAMIGIDRESVGIFFLGI